METILCLWEGPKFLIFSSNVPGLLYYSHIPSMVIALILGFYVLFKAKDEILKWTLFTIILTFSFWSFFDLVTWAHNDTRLIMFLWSLIILIEALIYLASFYFIQVYTTKRDVSLTTKVLFFIIFLPVFIFLPTVNTLSSISIETGLAEEGLISTIYIYILEIAIIFWSLIYSIKSFKGERNFKLARENLIVSLGVVFFLTFFFLGNILGSYTGKWEYGQYGLFGMPVFIGFLTYVIVKYNAFDVKLLGAQALVVTLVVLIFSQIFFVKTLSNKVLVSITLGLAFIFGYFLIRSVKDEIRQKDELKEITGKLGDAYERLHKLDRAKSEFLSIASHQLRTPLTSIKGFTSLLIEGAYGKIPSRVEEVLEKVYISNERLIKLVEDLLNISRIESGRVSFDFKNNNIEHLVKEIYNSFVIMSKNKKLRLEFVVPDEKVEPFVFDYAKIREVLSNLVDNSIKYTKKGWVSISLRNFKDKVQIVVSDTGIGIDPSEVDYIFEKFQRGQGVSKIQTEGVGLGLYVCEKMIKSHNGRIWAESEGVGRGSRFFIELDKNFKSSS